MATLWVICEQSNDGDRAIIDYVKDKYDLSEQDVVFLIERSEVNRSLGSAMAPVKKKSPSIANGDMIFPTGKFQISWAALVILGRNVSLDVKTLSMIRPVRGSSIPEIEEFQLD